MKKISNIGQLKAEKQKLMQQQLELENAIRRDWLQIGDSLQPKNIAMQALSAVFSNPGPGKNKSLLNYLVAFAAAGLTRKLFGKLKNKVAGWFA